MDGGGPIVIIEDDEDDQEILKRVFENLQITNELMFFSDGQSALNYLMNPKVLPFLILSDINMPKLNGFELREKLRVDADLSIKCIPYLFFSTALDQKSVIDAYSKSAQGFFVKDSSFDELQKTVSIMVEYWRRCAAPNRFTP